MTRHSKNSTNSSVYTYHERQVDTKKSGYGLQRERLTKDAVKNYNACNLTLQACRNPVITPEGVLYDKAAILEYILSQKMLIAKQTKRYEKELAKRQREVEEGEEKDQEERAKKFAKLESNVFHEKPSSSTPSSGTASTLTSGSSSSTSAPTKAPVPSSATFSGPISNMAQGNDKEMPSFWTPASGPSNKKEVVAKPVNEILCPISNKPLKASKLIEIEFTPVDPKVKDHLKAEYKCAVTHDLLTNSSRCVVLKTSGKVVTQECADKLIKKDMIDPISSKKMKPTDFIPLAQGGTGYASANKLEAEIKKPSLMVA